MGFLHETGLNSSMMSAIKFWRRQNCFSPWRSFHAWATEMCKKKPELIKRGSPEGLWWKNWDRVRNRPGFVPTRLQTVWNAYEVGERNSELAALQSYRETYEQFIAFLFYFELLVLIYSDEQNIFRFQIWILHEFGPAKSAGVCFVAPNLAKKT